MSPYSGIRDNKGALLRQGAEKSNFPWGEGRIHGNSLPFSKFFHKRKKGPKDEENFLIK